MTEHRHHYTMQLTERPDLHRRHPDVSPRLLDALAHLNAEYGPAGVAATVEKLHPRPARRAQRRTLPPRSAAELIGTICGCVLVAAIACAALAGCWAIIDWSLSSIRP